MIELSSHNFLFFTNFSLVVLERFILLRSCIEKLIKSLKSNNHHDLLSKYFKRRNFRGRNFREQKKPRNFWNKLSRTTHFKVFRENKLSRMTAFRIFRGNKLSRTAFYGQKNSADFFTKNFHMHKVRRTFSMSYKTGSN